MAAGFAQLINGLVYDFSSISIQVATPAPTFITRITSISWEQSLTPGVLRGNSAHKLGRSRGTYEASGSMTIYLEEWRLFRAALMLAPIPPLAGFMEKSFLCTVTAAEGTSLPMVDVLNGCRITNESRAYQNGGDALMVDLSFDIMRIVSDGQSAVRDKSGII
jgi:hypothetical protein